MSWSADNAATLAAYYPGFRPTTPPDISGALRAWHGTLCPLAIASEQFLVLDDLDRGKIVRVLLDGKLHHDPDCRVRHKKPSYADSLWRLDTSFFVTIVDFGFQRHPQTYASRPAISGFVFPTHPHLRRDQLAWINGTPVHALCTYLASDGVVQHDDSALVQVLDYTSMFLAKHLVWRSSATLTHYASDCAPRALALDPTGVALHFRPDPKTANSLRWEGYWPGPQAPHDIATLLATVRAIDECPCGTGKTYDDCCRTGHVSQQRQALQERIETLFYS